jgi:CHAT domain-containing protein/tetratricopeptide (TPR) repeat protein
MIWQWRLGCVALGTVMVLAADPIPLGCTASFAQELSAEAKVALRERDRLLKEAQRFRQEGKLAEAIAAAEAMLPIERKVFPADHDDLVGALGWLADLELEYDQFAKATAARVEALEILTKRLGATHWKVTDARVALENVKTRALLTREQRRQLGEADRLGLDAGALYQQGKYAEATRSARRALAMRKEVLGERHLDYATSLNNLALLLNSQEDRAAARPLYERALAIRKEVLGERHPDYATSLNNLASLLYSQGAYAAARPLFEQALTIKKEVLGERHPDYAQSLNNLAFLLYSQGDYAAARSLYERALAINKDVLGERHPEYATSLNNLALLLSSQGDYASARPLIERALAIRKEALGERHPLYAKSLNDLAAALYSQGDYAAARPLFERAVALIKELLGERHPDLATSLNNLALLLESQADYAAARPLYERALAIYKEVQGERHPDYARSLNNLAQLLNSQGDYASARPLYERALAIRKEVLGERHPDYASSLNSLAYLLYLQRDYDSARPLYERALVIRREVLGERHPDYAQSLDNLAVLLGSQGDRAAARPLYERALAIRKEVLGERHPEYATNLSNLGCLMWKRGDAAEANSLLTRALEIAEGNLDLAAAAQSERQQLAMAHALRHQLDAYLSISRLAKPSAEDVYRHVLVTKGAVLERQRRLRTQRGLLQASPGSEGAKRFDDYTRTVTQLATMALSAPPAGKAEQWKSRLEELSRRKDELEAELSRFDAGFRAAQTIAARTPAELQASLPDATTALVDFLVYRAYQPPTAGKGEFQFERRLVAFVLRRGRPIERVELGPIAAIQKAVDDWRPWLLDQHAATAVIDAGRALRRLVWEPLEAHLEGVSSVVVSPDGPIALVPLAALPGRDPSRYLIEDCAIAIVPVPRMLASAAAGSAAGRRPGVPSPLVPSLLLAGDIDYGGAPGKGGELAVQRTAATSTRAGLLREFEMLPSTRGEILQIRDSFEERFANARVEMLRRNQATEEAVRQKAPHSRYLHFATHGYFAPPELRSALGPADPKTNRLGFDPLGGAGVAGWHPGLLSGIALAGANVRPTPIGQDDGILTALEVAELDLSNVELAVLSACETGLGEVAGGEGLLGLQRAFQVAGAHSVIASLWKIGDEPTRTLMARFYENLWRKNQPPAQALREAQLAMLRGDLMRGTLKREKKGETSDRMPPYYWTAFVLSSDQP